MDTKRTARENYTSFAEKSHPLLVFIIIPLGIMAIDFLLRAAYSLDLTDVGADMSLLAISALISLLIEQGRSKSQQPWSPVAAVLLGAIIVWILCLKAIGDLSDPAPRSETSRTIIQSLVWAFGFLSLLFASAIVYFNVEPISETGSEK